MKEFNPWDIKTELPELDISEPPCKNCINWHPQQTFNSCVGKGFIPCGIRLCHAEKMYRDFSCYKEKEGLQ